MQSDARTVEEYLSQLSEDRRTALSAVREVILQNMDSNLEEGIQYGHIGYFIPHRLYPAGYHCDPRQPLPFAGLASQKGHMAIYLMCVYIDGREADFRNAWLKTGKKLDMGKSCVRFRKIDDVALEVIADLFKHTTVDAFIEKYESSIPKSAISRSVRPAAKKKVAKSARGSAVSARETKSKTVQPRAARKKKP